MGEQPQFTDSIDATSEIADQIIERVSEVEGADGSEVPAEAISAGLDECVENLDDLSQETYDALHDTVEGEVRGRGAQIV